MILWLVVQQQQLQQPALDHDVYIIGVDGSNDMRDNIKMVKALATALPAD